MLNYAKAKEYTEYEYEYEYYIDGGYSGKDLNRPAIQKLISDCKSGKIDCVFVFKLDRISRSQKDTLYLIEEVFNKYNVGFISIRENFDTTTPFGKAMIGILSVFAQLERETILERTRIGIQKRAESGLWRGGGKIPYAYDYDSTLGILVPNKDRVEKLHNMISLYLDGLSFNKLESIFGMDESLISQIILNRTNLGIVPYKGQEFIGQHEAVVSEETYNRLIETIKMRSKTRTERHYLLSGKIYCGKCGAKYRYQKWGKRLVCYCYSQQKSKPKFIKDPNCQNKRWDSFEIEDAVLECLFAMALDENLFRTNYKLTEVNVLEEYENRLIKVRKQIENLVNFIADDIAVEVTKKKLENLEQEKETLEKEISDIKSKNEKNINKLDILKNLQSSWFNMTFDEQRLIIEHIVDKVIVTNNNIDIKLKIS